MAKRKKTTKRHHRRRRIGALSLNASSPLVKYGSVAGGYFLGDKVNDAIDNATGGKVDGKIIAGAELALGFLLMTKGKRSTAKSVAGGILLGAGAKKALKEFGVISGLDNVPVLSGYRVPAPLPNSVNGFQSVPVLNGMGGYRVPQSVVGSVADNGGYNAGDFADSGYRN